MTRRAAVARRSEVLHNEATDALSRRDISDQLDEDGPWEDSDAATVLMPMQQADGRFGSLTTHWIVPPTVHTDIASPVGQVSRWNACAHCQPLRIASNAVARRPPPQSTIASTAITLDRNRLRAESLDTSGTSVVGDAL
jgi:hypothetical protein